jgi:hypothetical protein
MVEHVHEHARTESDHEDDGSSDELACNQGL